MDYDLSNLINYSTQAMYKTFVITFKFALFLAIIFVLYLIFVITMASFKEFEPEKIIMPEKDTDNSDTINTEKDYNIITWNIGYAGLGKEMDFFYEGGKQVRTDKMHNSIYLREIRNFITNHKSADFILLQEVDFQSARSYKIDQGNFVSNSLTAFRSYRAINYKSFFVPLPFTNPMGRVESGIVTCTKNIPFQVSKIASTATYSWPKRLFTPRRCFLITSYKVGVDHLLHIINLHNSAYDDAGGLREAELKFIRDFGITEYSKGNYVIFGGDWNQNPPGIKNIPGKYRIKEVRMIETRFMPDEWQWAFDESVPSNRDVNEPFNKSTTDCSLIDFYLCSPNILVNSVKVIDLEFTNSDHNPAVMNFRLSGDK